MIADPQDRRAARLPTVAIVLGTTDRFHSRTHRIADSLTAAGYRVVVLSRRDAGDAPSEVVRGWRVERVPMPLVLEGVRRAAIGRAGGDGTRGTGGRRLELRRAIPSPVRAALRRVLALVPPELLAPRLAARLAPVAPRADVWHAVGLIALPAALRLSARLGGRVVYDSVEIHLGSGRYLRYPRPVRAVLARLERRWARRADAVTTVGDPYAREIEQRLGRRVAVIWNVPPRFRPPQERDARLRTALGVGADVPIVVYHGRISADRGVEQLIDAAPLLPDVLVVVMGYGDRRAALAERARLSPASDRIRFLDPVPPGDLIGWLSGADVCAMPIQGTTLNHRLSTPNKLFEAIGAGVPVVVSDLPGMAPIVRELGVGETCDPSDPADVARAVRVLIERPSEERAALRARCLAAAHERFNWEAQAERLIVLLSELGVPPGVRA